jgi:HK97 family phage prohead protease
MTDQALAVREFMRTFELDDATIRSDGDGRTVEAYAAVFDSPAEIRDHDGHYMEELARTSFDKTLMERGTDFAVLFNHGKTIYGTPDGSLSVPIGVPLEVSRDDKGVFTATRYLDNPLADSILDGIKQKAIKGYSFVGRTIKSTRMRATARGALPTIVRNEIAMREYGPGLFPYYPGATILATRSASAFLDELAELAPEDVDRFRQMLGIATPQEPADAEGTSSEAARAAQEPHEHSTRQIQFKFAVAARQRGILP